MTLFYDFGDGEFEYELDNRKAISYIAGKYAKEIKTRASETDENMVKTIIQSFIEDNNLEEATMEVYQEELEDDFYDEAQQSYAEMLNEQADLEWLNYDYEHSRF